MDQRTPRPALSDLDVISKTGRSWDQWFEVLDEAGALQLERKAIARLLSEKFRVGPFWRRQVIVEYERARGRRARHAAGNSVHITRTMDVDLAKAYAASIHSKGRRRWFPPGVVEVLSAVENTSLHATWGQSAHLDIGFRPRQDAKIVVTVHLSQLEHEEDIERQRSVWKKALIKLEAMLID